jgi:hypothetical protein
VRRILDERFHRRKPVGDWDAARLRSEEWPTTSAFAELPSTPMMATGSTAAKNALPMTSLSGQAGPASRTDAITRLQRGDRESKPSRGVNPAAIVRK